MSVKLLPLFDRLEFGVVGVYSRKDHKTVEVSVMLPGLEWRTFFPEKDEFLAYLDRLKASVEET